MLLQIPEANVWLWYDARTTRIPTPRAGISIDELEIEGFMPFPAIDTPHHLPIHLMLQSQILSSLLYSDTEGKHKCFASPESVHHIVKKAPVFLGSLQDFPETIMMVRHSHPYPPKEHGTAAVVLHQDHQYEYLINDLPPEAQERQKAISQLIEVMQSIPQQETVNVFTDSPEELRNMMQRLAEDYYAFHQVAQNSNKPLPTTVDAFNAAGIAKMLSAHPIQAYSVASTAPLTAWRDYMSLEKENELIVDYSFAKKNGKGTSYVLFKEDITGLSREIVLENIKNLS